MALNHVACHISFHILMTDRGTILLYINDDINFMFVSIIMNLHIGISYRLYFRALKGKEILTSMKTTNLGPSMVPNLLFVLFGITFKFCQLYSKTCPVS